MTNCVHLVDDDAAVRGASSLLLETVGFDVTSFVSPEVFLAQADKFKPRCLKPGNGCLRDMDARMVIQAGALPIRIGGALVGGIGVGGAPSGAIDADCARGP